jgi:hypothetical protein
MVKGITNAKIVITTTTDTEGQGSIYDSVTIKDVVIDAPSGFGFITKMNKDLLLNGSNKINNLDVVFTPSEHYITL